MKMYSYITIKEKEGKMNKLLHLGKLLRKKVMLTSYICH